MTTYVKDCDCIVYFISKEESVVDGLQYFDKLITSNGLKNSAFYTITTRKSELPSHLIQQYEQLPDFSFVELNNGDGVPEALQAIHDSICRAKA